VSVYPPIVARYKLSKDVPATSRIVEGVVLYAVYVVSKESRRLVRTRTYCCYYLHTPRNMEKCGYPEDDVRNEP
jgi:hypothetical protein